MSGDREPTEAEIALGKCVVIALGDLSYSKGSGLMLMNGRMQHWKHHFADALEKIPGVKVDRDALFPTKQGRGAE
jgi:hypothetical protein